MALYRGFKSWATAIAAEVRGDLGLGPFERLDPRTLASSLDIPIIELSELATDGAHVQHLLAVEPSAFSAVTVFAGTRRTIVHNDAHQVARQNSNLCHELSHGLLSHPPTPAMDDSGCRIWDQDVEDEASWLASCLLLTEPAALAIAKGRWTRQDAAARFAVSIPMIQFRLNSTGAERRISRARARS